MLKSLWKITILTVDPKLRRYVKGFTKNNNPIETLYFKHMYKIRYDEIVKRIDKRAWYFSGFFYLYAKFTTSIMRER